MMKKCFKCQKNKPLFLFANNHMKYQIPSDRGKLIECRLCSVKRIIIQQGNVVRYNNQTKRFGIVYIKPTIINLIKEYFK